jgi:Holliday junction resolvasome RuvABC DNA-binding subunit
MIATVRGRLAMVDGDRAVIEVGGLGLEVLASGRTLGGLSPHLGEEVGLHTFVRTPCSSSGSATRGSGPSFSG